MSVISGTFDVRQEMDMIKKLVPGDRVRWTDRKSTSESTGTVVDRTKRGEYRKNPDHRGRYLIQWDGPHGACRRCNQLHAL